MPLSRIGPSHRGRVPSGSRRNGGALRRSSVAWRRGAAGAAMWWQLRAFGGALVFFHASEFLLAALLDREHLSARCERGRSIAGRTHPLPGLAWCEQPPAPAPTTAPQRCSSASPTRPRWRRGWLSLASAAASRRTSSCASPSALAGWASRCWSRASCCAKWQWCAHEGHMRMRMGCHAHAHALAPNPRHAGSMQPHACNRPGAPPRAWRAQACSHPLAARRHAWPPPRNPPPGLASTPPSR